MKIRTFFYTIRQGVVNLFRNKWYTLASIATIAACLFMFGIFYSVVANFQHMVKSMQKEVSVTVFFDEGISQERVEQIGALITARTEEVDHIRFVSAEEAWQWYQEEYFGDQKEEFLAGYPTNPLADSFNYEVYLKDVAKQEQLVTYLESIPGVRNVNYDTVANTLSGVNSLISYVSIGIILILLGVSIFLISNTVTVGISLLDCIGSTVEATADKVYEKVVRYAEKLVPTCRQMEGEYGIPIVNKRVSVTPVSLILNGEGEKGAIVAKAIKEAEVIAFDELGCESIKRMKIEDFPATVAIDARGNNLFVTGRKEYCVK